MDFKRRFIAGYDPNNKWNVEWQSWTEPMNLNWRNWGGGGFRLAPPPNLVPHPHSVKTTYRQVLEDRLTAILEQVVTSVNTLERQDKGELFAGVSLGTEISLNASATPQDEFMPYGYRAMSDFLEDKSATSSADLQLLRQQVVAEYLFDLSRLAHQIGIPKQRLYTHVWGEADESDPKFAPYAPAAFNLYSRPGMSFYGFAEDPYASNSWLAAQTESSFQNWGAVEYSVPPDSIQAKRALANTLDGSSSLPPAKVVVLYNWSEHKQTPAIPALAKILTTDPSSHCQLNEVIIDPSVALDNPQALKWSTVGPSRTLPEVTTIKFIKGHITTSQTLVAWELPVEGGSQELSTDTIPQGVYSWFVETEGCNHTQKRTSAPQVMFKPLIVKEDTPKWIEMWLEWETQMTN